MYAVVMAVVLSLVAPQDRDKDKTVEKPTVEKARGYLPQGWKQLGLTQEQREKVYTIQTDYRKQRSVLEQQLRALKQRERDELSKVLTEAQKKRLVEIRSGTGTKEK